MYVFGRLNRISIGENLSLNNGGPQAFGSEFIPKRITTFSGYSTYFILKFSANLWHVGFFMPNYNRGNNNKIPRNGNV